MSRTGIVLIAALVIIVGGLFFLASRKTEVPLTRVEKPVTLGNAAAR